MATAYRNHFKKANWENGCFMKDKFDIFPFRSSKYSCSDTNMINQIQNSFCKAISRCIKLPKFVVIVLDNDLTQYLAFINQGAASLLGEMFEWLVKTFLAISQERKDMLPIRAVRTDYPQFYFVAPLRHRNFGDNFIRSTLFHCMESTAKLYNDVRIIKLVKIWNFDDMDLVTAEGQFTSLGLSSYLAAIDSAVQFNVQKREQYLSTRGLTKGGRKDKVVLTRVQEDRKMRRFFKKARSGSTITTFGRLPTPPKA